MRGLMPRLKTCCGGCSLKTGALLTAGGSIFFIGLQMILLAAFLPAVRDVFFETFFPRYERTEALVGLFYEIVTFVFLILAFYLFVNITLLVGVSKRNACLMRPWLMLTSLGIIIFALFVILLLLSFEFVYVWYLIVLFLPYHSINIYLFLVVHSFHQKVMDRKTIYLSLKNGI